MDFCEGNGFRYIGDKWRRTMEKVFGEREVDFEKTGRSMLRRRVKRRNWKRSVGFFEVKRSMSRNLEEKGRRVKRFFERIIVRVICRI